MNFGKSQITHLSFPTSGDRPIMTDARAVLTCWLASFAKALGRDKSNLKVRTYGITSILISMLYSYHNVFISIIACHLPR